MRSISKKRPVRLVGQLEVGLKDLSAGGKSLRVVLHTL